MQVRRARLAGKAEEADDLARLDAIPDGDRRSLFQMFVGGDAPAADVEHDIVAAGVGDRRIRSARPRRGVGHIVAQRDNGSIGDREHFGAIAIVVRRIVGIAR